MPNVCVYLDGSTHPSNVFAGFLLWHIRMASRRGCLDLVKFSVVGCLDLELFTCSNYGFSLGCFSSWISCHLCC
jgi:hypothetical protein